MPKLLEEQYKRRTFTFNYVDLEIVGDLAYITVNRPEAMNALNPTVVDQLEQKFDEAESNPPLRQS